MAALGYNLLTMTGGNDFISIGGPYDNDFLATVYRQTG